MVFRCPQAVLWVDSSTTADSVNPLWVGVDRVLRVQTVSEAVGLLRESRIDAAVVEIDANVESRAKFVHWLRRRYGHLPVLVCARRHSPALERQVRQWGVTAYLTSTMDPALLVRLLDQLRWPALVKVRATERRAAALAG
jgi:DNA-binding NarL/FixJ family response regulator